MMRLRASDPGAIERAADALRRGLIVAYPTDTLYGLAADPRRDDAVARLYAAKGRDERSAIALIAADVPQAQTAGPFGAAELRLAARFWPGPLTIVVPAAAGMSRLLSSERRTLGVRVPAQPVARAIAAALGSCITATSANRSGQPPAIAPDEVESALGDAVAVLIDDGPAPGGLPSTLVEVVDDVPVQHRPGAIGWERVLEFFQ